MRLRKQPQSIERRKYCCPLVYGHKVDMKAEKNANENMDVCIYSPNVLSTVNRGLLGSLILLCAVSDFCPLSSLTSGNLVTSFSRPAQPPQDAVRVAVDKHSCSVSFGRKEDVCQKNRFSYQHGRTRTNKQMPPGWYHMVSSGR